MTAKRTSFTVAPWVRAICLITSKLLRIRARLRSGPTTRSRLVTGPRLSEMSSPIAGHTDRTLRSVITGRIKIANARRSPSRRLRRLSAKRSRAVGAGAGVQPGAGSASLSGVASRSAANGGQPGDAVGYSVMDLDQQADPVFREPRKEPHLPERS